MILVFVVERLGIEPSCVSWVQTKRPPLAVPRPKRSRGGCVFSFVHLHDFTCGAPSGTRTRDLCRDRATSTPTGPPGHRVVRLVGLGIEWVSVVEHFRAGGRPRTRDILVTNQALCRTELHRRVECRLPAERRVGSGPRFDLVYTGETLNTRQNRRESRRKTTWRPALPSRWSLLLRSVSWRRF